MKNTFWPDKSTLLHLRFPFSFFLMPVYMFALSTADDIYWTGSILSFIILHFLVFPSSNGYNSFYDKDESSIGVLRNPPPVSKNLYYITMGMDILAISLSLFISVYFAALTLLFTLVSRSYSYRPIRLKRFPVISLILVSVFQGGVVYLMSFMAITNQNELAFISSDTIICMGIASLFIGSIYPLTQIYQHKADKNDGVVTISYKLGYVGTFIFSAILFVLATFLVYMFFSNRDQMHFFQLFLLIMLPVVGWFLIWFIKVLKNESHANYSNTMYMNFVTATCMNLFFLFLTFNRYAGWY